MSTFPFSPIALALSAAVGCGSSGPVRVGDDGAEIEPTISGIAAYLNGKAHRSWTAEPAAHDSTLGSPHGRVRVYFNQTSLEALRSGTVPLPVGSMLVKELLSSDDVSVRGYTTMVKTSPGSWTWYEGFSGSLNAPAAYGVDVGVCKGCHSNTGNRDQVRSPPP